MKDLRLENSQARIWALSLALGISICSLCSGAEVIHLKNGFLLDADSHLTDGATVTLYMGTGSLVLQEVDISAIEVLRDAKSQKQNAEPVKSVLEPQKILTNAAEAYGVDAAFVRSVARVESGLRQNAVSAKGAIGLMQLMPATAAELKVDPTEAAGNASGGAQYLRELLLRYKGDSVLALAAYNAGPGAVQKFKGLPPFRETRQYVNSVLKEYRTQVAAQKADKPAAKPPNTPTAID